MQPSEHPAAEDNDGIEGPLASVVRLSGAGDLVALDQYFLESICELLRLDYALLCVATARGKLTRVKRYRVRSGQGYETVSTGEALTPEQQGLIEQARKSPRGRQAIFQGERQLAVYTCDNPGGGSASLLLESRASEAFEHVFGFDMLLRVYFNLRQFMDRSQRDSLTGLLNRRYFDDCIHRVLEVIEAEKVRVRGEAERRGDAGASPRHWLAMLDIDHFKQFNDRYGHLYGDEILLLFARIMETTFRASDLLFRFGGEEFVVIMESSDASEARAALERFRLAVQNHAFPRGEQATVSAGVVEVSGGETAAALLDRADQALYRAKREGRNRTVMYEAPQRARHAEGVAACGDIELF